MISFFFCVCTKATLSSVAYQCLNRNGFYFLSLAFGDMVLSTAVWTLTAVEFVLWYVAVARRYCIFDIDL